VIEKRIPRRVNRNSHYVEYDYLVINDRLPYRPWMDLKAILRSQPLEPELASRNAIRAIVGSALVRLGCNSSTPARFLRHRSGRVELRYLRIKAVPGVTPPWPAFTVEELPGKCRNAF